MDQVIKKLICTLTAFILALCLPLAVMAAETDATAKYLLNEVPEPTCDSVGGEWTVVALAGSSYDVPDKYFDTYYKNLENIVRERKGVLDEESYTEYSRVAIALSSINKSALDVAGYDLAKPLTDFEKITAQGLNGAIYALIALDAGGYIGPRKQLREYILQKELPSGGWNFTGKGEADPDMTAMAVQALSHYRFCKDVKPAIERAMPMLEKNYYESSETISQVINALHSIDEEIPTSLTKELLKYRINDGSFMHCLDDEEGNIMSTEQALIALSKVSS